MSCLRVEEIGITFGGLAAVSDVSFAVEPGEIMGLIGPNGAGKTTTLNLISGLYEVDSGRVFLNDQDVTKKTAYERARLGLGRTFQTPHMLTRSTVSDNMKLGTDLADQMGFFKSFLGVKGHNFLDEVDGLMEIADLHAARQGIGIVLIEHKMDMIMNVCDHIVVLNFGKMIAHGTPDEVSEDEAVIEAYLGRK